MNNAVTGPHICLHIACYIDIGPAATEWRLPGFFFGRLLAAHSTQKSILSKAAAAMGWPPRHSQPGSCQVLFPSFPLWQQGPLVFSFLMILFGNKKKQHPVIEHE